MEAKAKAMIASMDRFNLLCKKVTLEERLKRYNDLAKFYDSDSEVLDWVGPQIMAEAVKKHIPDKNTYFLDMCGGTGHCAEELHKLGYSHFDVLDGSLGMVRIAMDGPNLYSRYIIDHIPDDPVKDQCTVLKGDLYDAVIMSGGHASAGKVMEMIRLVKPRGYCISVMWGGVDCGPDAGELDAAEYQKIMEHLRAAEKLGKCQIVSEEELKETSVDEKGNAFPGHTLVWQKLAN